MRFEELFVNAKPVIAMVHLNGDSAESVLERAKQEIDIYLRNGVDAVLAENYFGSVEDVERTLDYLHEHLPDAIYGVNVLGNYGHAFELAERYGAKFIQIDSVCGHLPPLMDDYYDEELIALRRNSDAVLLGGVRFKYQRVRSGRSVAEDVRLGMERCDAIVVTGEGTRLATPLEKVKAFRSIVGDYPLIVGAGVTLNSLYEDMKYCDGFIVGSWFKENHEAEGEVC